MKELIDTDRITLEYDANEKEYRLSLFDKYYHYLDEIYLSPKQLKELIENGKDLEIICEDDDI